MSAGGIRDAEATRRHVLSAAREVLTEKGAALTIQEGADRAGVSKSGLLHHFATKNLLLTAVVEFYLDEIFDAVTQLRKDRSPGSFTRAYVRALCGEDPVVRNLFVTFDDIADPLSAVAGVDELYRSDTERWNRCFLDDGLHPDQLLLVRYAAEGIAMAASSDELMESGALERAHLILSRLANSPMEPKDLWADGGRSGA